MTKKRSFSHNSVEVRLNVVLQILESKKSVIEVANSLNLYPDTVNRWVNAYKENEILKKFQAFPKGNE